MLMNYYNQQEENLERLIDYAIEINDPNYDVAGEPLITSCVKENRLDLVKQLVSHGAKVNNQSLNKDSFGQTPLMEAAYHGFYELAHYLINNGANLDLQNKMGHTALLLAVINRKSDLVQLLVEHHADVNCMDKNKLTPLMIASGKGFFDIASLLVSHGANVHHQDEDGDTALHLAYSFGDFDLVSLLRN
jgi:uncharacterized protein